MEAKNGKNGGRGGGFPDAPEVKDQESKVNLSKTFNAQHRRGGATANYANYANGDGVP
jgi:hypothetical protein